MRPGHARVGACALAALLMPACSAILQFEQCKVDSDCVAGTSAGTPMYCTSDQICVTDVPSERLCELSDVSSTRGDAVTVAGLFRRTGPNEVVDTAIEHAVVLAVDEINTIGATRPLRLVLCDTANDPDQAKKALIAAADRYGAVAAVGPTSSSEVIALAASPDLVAQRHDFLIVSCSATSPSVTNLADDQLIWRTAASDALQGAVLASLVPATTKRVASAFVKSPYGSGLNDAFVASVSELVPGVAVLPKEFAEGTPGDAVVQWLASMAPEVALIVADSDAPAWVAALNNGGSALASTKFLLTDGSKAPALFSMGPSTAVANRITGTAPGTPSGPAFSVFQSTYAARFNGVDPSTTAFVANAYDAMYTIAIAMGTIPPGSPVTGHGLAVGMQRLSDSGPNALVIRVGPGQFSAGYQELAQGGLVNLDGTSGPIDFDPDTGDILGASIATWKINTTAATGGTCAPPAGSVTSLCTFQ